MKFLYIINKRYKRKQKGTASVDFGVSGSGRSTGSYLGWSLFTFKIFGFTLLSEVRPTVASGDDERRASDRKGVRDARATDDDERADGRYRLPGQARPTGNSGYRSQTYR